MKKLIRISVCVCLALSMILTGCSSNKSSSSVKVGALKGPTSIGLVNLMDKAAKKETKTDFSFEMAAAADELLPRMISGELDIALIPANVASVLYNKTNGGIKVIDINTLGVLYAVSGDESIKSASDLEGKTVYIPNKGTTPDYVLSYILEKSGINKDRLNIEYKSEATEVAAMLKENTDAVGILPQPFVTACCIQNEELKAVLDLTKEWEAVTEDGSRLVTGVTVVRNEFLNSNEKAVKEFLKEHQLSEDACNKNIDVTADLVVSAGIIEKAPVAKKAIPNCNITYIDGKEMKDALSGYLKVLYELNSESVGGKLPGEDFYY